MLPPTLFCASRLPASVLFVPTPLPSILVPQQVLFEPIVLFVPVLFIASVLLLVPIGFVLVLLPILLLIPVLPFRVPVLPFRVPVADPVTLLRPMVVELVPFVVSPELTLGVAAAPVPAPIPPAPTPACAKAEAVKAIVPHATAARKVFFSIAMTRSFLRVLRLRNGRHSPLSGRTCPDNGLPGKSFPASQTHLVIASERPRLRSCRNSAEFTPASEQTTCRAGTYPSILLTISYRLFESPETDAMVSSSVRISRCRSAS